MQPRRVLIVDDNRHAREVLSDILRSIGLLPTAVDSGERALAELSTAAREAHGYDLALIDWRMPGVDGIETAQRLRAQSALASLPTVLMVTAYASEKVLQSAEQLNLAGRAHQTGDALDRLQYFKQDLQQEAGGRGRGARLRCGDHGAQPAHFRTARRRLWRVAASGGG